MWHSELYCDSVAAMASTLRECSLTDENCESSFQNARALSLETSLIALRAAEFCS
jgi:hypothetical protein